MRLLNWDAGAQEQDEDGRARRGWLVCARSGHWRSLGCVSLFIFHDTVYNTLPMCFILSTIHTESKLGYILHLLSSTSPITYYPQASLMFSTCLFISTSASHSSSPRILLSPNHLSYVLKSFSYFSLISHPLKPLVLYCSSGTIASESNMNCFYSKYLKVFMFKKKTTDSYMILLFARRILSQLEEFEASVKPS